jgi:hypothetical protein
MTLTLPRRALVDPDELPPLSLRASVPQPFTPISTDPGALDDFELGREWLRQLNWGLFETLVETAFVRDGFLVLPAPIRMAGRADMVLERRSERLFVQCKHWKAWQVGTPTVRELQELVSSNGGSGGIVITAGKYSAEALGFAADCGVILLDGDDLLRMAAGAPVLPLAEETVPQWTAPKAWTAFGAPSCPVCDSPMLYKRVRVGAHAGARFWGCPHFPSCRAIREAGPGSVLPLERPVAGESTPQIIAAEPTLPASPPVDDSIPAAPTASPGQTLPAEPVLALHRPEPSPVEVVSDSDAGPPFAPTAPVVASGPPDEQPAGQAPSLPLYTQRRVPASIQPAALRAPTFATAPGAAQWAQDSAAEPSPPTSWAGDAEPQAPTPAAELAPPLPVPTDDGRRRSTMRLMAVIGICAAAAVLVAVAVPAILQAIKLISH